MHNAFQGQSQALQAIKRSPGIPKPTSDLTNQSKTKQGESEIPPAMEGPDPWEGEENQLKIIRDILHVNKGVPAEQSETNASESAEEQNIIHADIHAEILDSRRQRLEASLEKDLGHGKDGQKPTSSKSTKSSEPTPQTAISDSAEPPRGTAKSKAEQLFRIIEEGRELFEGNFPQKPDSDSTDSDEETFSQGEKLGEFTS